MIASVEEPVLLSTPFLLDDDSLFIVLQLLTPEGSMFPVVAVFSLEDLDLSETAEENDDSIVPVFQLLALDASAFVVLLMLSFEYFEIVLYDPDNFVETTEEFQ